MAPEKLDARSSHTPVRRKLELVGSDGLRCCLIASDTEPVREFVGPNSAALVDFRTKGWLNPAVTNLLSDDAFAEGISKAAVEAAGRYDERQAIKAWKSLLICQNANRAVA